MRIEVSHGVAWRDLGADVVILNVETSIYFGLDRTPGQFAMTPSPEVSGRDIGVPFR
jgi:hypothetical protein